VPDVTIAAAATPEQFRVARRLFEDYQRGLGIDLCFQGFAAELEALPVLYGPPRGLLLLATRGSEPVGCVAVRPLEGSVAEMKRMYVLESCRGQGIGAALTDRCLAGARALGYTALRLDTLARLGAAVALYRTRGFRDIPPYRANPEADAVYLERSL
jgi:ribosomal protein S18 acetylase RimI-like enzyme